MRYCFDTSGLNRLHDDPARDAIATALLETGAIRITAYNVLEAAKTREPAKRHSLVTFMRRLSDYKRPIDPPNSLVRAVARSYAARSDGAKASFTIDTDPHLQGVWAALDEPTSLDEETREEALEWAKTWEGHYDSIAVDGRERFQEILAAHPGRSVPTSAFTIHSYMRQRDQIFDDLVAPIYEKETGQTLSRAAFEEMMQEPLWSLYLAGYAYAVHHRSVKVDCFSRRKNAGGIDLGQAVYLRLCDRFITNDRAQHRALRFLNQFSRAAGYESEVLTYDAFRRRLLPFG